MKKRLIALMCAGVIGLSMAGCSSIQENIEDLANNPLNENSQDIIYADKYIVLAFPHLLQQPESLTVLPDLAHTE